MKYIKVTFSDNRTYHIPAEVVAKNRAEHYKDDGYDEEFEYAMNNDRELLDWAVDNMNWSDVEPFAVRMNDKVVEVNKEKEWLEVEKEIIEY